MNRQYSMLRKSSSKDGPVECLKNCIFAESIAILSCMVQAAPEAAFLISITYE